MRTPLLNLPLQFSCLFVYSGYAFAAEERDSSSYITIHLYDYAGMETEQFEEVKLAGSRILDRAGVSTQWAHCKLASAKNASRVSCARPQQDDTHLIVRLLPEVMAEKIVTPIRALGISLMSKNGLSVDAYVFVDRARIVAQRERLSVQAILGVAIAHEVGHLLQAEESHSVTGMMSARWGSKEMRDALMGVLGFTRKQTERMNANVNRRNCQREE